MSSIDARVRTVADFALARIGADSPILAFQIAHAGFFDEASGSVLFKFGRDGVEYVGGIAEIVSWLQKDPDFGRLFPTRTELAPINSLENPWRKRSSNLTQRMHIAKTDPELAKRLMADADTAGDLILGV